MNGEMMLTKPNHHCYHCHGQHHRDLDVEKNRQGFSLAASSRSTSAADLMPSWSSRESESFALCLYATNSVMANLVAPDIKHSLISHF